MPYLEMSNMYDTITAAGKRTTDGMCSAGGQLMMASNTTYSGIQDSQYFRVSISADDGNVVGQSNFAHNAGQR